MANARLIASAPELLTSLIELRAVVASMTTDLGGCDHGVGICMCPELVAITRADAAIAKATGGEP